MFVEKAKQFIVSHGAVAGTTFGAVTTQPGLIKVEALVQDALDHGAKIVSGVGKRMGFDGLEAISWNQPFSPKFRHASGT